MSTEIKQYDEYSPPPETRTPIAWNQVLATFGSSGGELWSKATSFAAGGWSFIFSFDTSSGRRLGEVVAKPSGAQIGDEKVCRQRT